MEIILNDLPQKYSQFRNKIINKLSASKDKYNLRRTNLLYFEGLAIIMDTFTTSQALINPAYSGYESLQQFIKLKSEMVKNGKSYSELIKEKKYVDLYQNFEDFFSEISFALYYYLYKKLYNRFDINELDLSDEYDYPELYEEAEKKTYRNLSSIYEKFIELKKDFNLFANIGDDNIKDLYVHSQNRNKLIHTYGKIDKIYLNKLSNINIKPRYKLNDEINKNLDFELYNLELLLMELVDSINYSIQKDSIILIKNYFSLS